MKCAVARLRPAQIEEQADGCRFPGPAARRRRALRCLSRRPRSALAGAERTAAYLVTRMPATYAAAHAVLREVSARIGAVGSILDAGAGTGAASLAALDAFPDAAVTLVERDAASRRSRAPMAARRDRRSPATSRASTLFRRTIW